MITDAETLAIIRAIFGADLTNSQLIDIIHERLTHV